ncbi:50S ribosomal protein L20 [Candidatus Uabimicrobium sp. HlEnr_7]|uniref:50S ribosomal protein L20 n=1 Tax=Candidatus Uabimicrobium helgolandensis TaxID=3095367 RepID=UPI0035584A29
MPRVTCSVARHKRKKRLMKKVKGYRGGRSKLLRTAKESYIRSQNYAYRDRKVKKRDFRKLWIIRINAAVREKGLSYSQFMYALKNANVELNRKVLSEMAINDPKGFDSLIELAKENLKAAS